MLRKRETPAFDQVDTLIGKDTTFRGNVTADGTVRVDGFFEGEILAKGDVVIGETGNVEANVQGRNILVAGKLKGSITASERMEVASTGQILGEMKVGSLIIDDGAIFQGNCQMTATEKTPVRKKELKLEQI